MLSDVMIGDLHIHKVYGIVEVVDADHHGAIKCLIVGKGICVDVSVAEFLSMPKAPKEHKTLRLARSLVVLVATIAVFASVALFFGYVGVDMCQKGILKC